MGVLCRAAQVRKTGAGPAFWFKWHPNNPRIPDEAMASKPLEIGDKAPPFSLPADGGQTISLAECKGKTLVLYFYPKDDTSGCTAEAIAFTKLAQEFQKAGAAVVGISKDSAKSHDKFKSKYELKVALAADEDTKTAQAYGVWIEKSMYGRRYMGVDRATFLIDKNGTIRSIWRKVKVPGHAVEVLTATKSL
jgi:thioredoxin-dependent peroxiredoxin